MAERQRVRATTSRALRIALLLVTPLTVLAADGPGDDEPWEVLVSGYAYFIPGDDDYLQPTVAADRGRTHLEARYNYEDRDTLSVWLGANFGGVSGDLEWGLTPMVGAAFGQTRGVAPGVEGWLAWRWLEFSTEGQYFFDAESSDDRFVYFWSELSVAPREWWRIGLVGQRTRVYDTELDVQRGLLLGFSGERWSLTGYLFNPDQDDGVLVVGADYAF
ncbi:MAG: hypothetical protein JNM50_01130 [Chromatiales bacterium]|nr:hypothetical protein [Chromatiales bacterium]